MINSKVLSIIIWVVVVLVVAVGAYYFGFQQGSKATEAAYKELIEKSGVTPTVINPAENLPTANPFEGVKLNPFEGIYKNPFK